AHGKTRKTLLDNERRDAAISRFRICVSKEHEDLCFDAVCDPELATVDDIMIALINRTGLHRKSIRARTRLTQGVSSNLFASELCQILLFLFGSAPPKESVVDQCVLNINKDSDRSVNSGQFFDSKNRLEECTSGATVLFRCFDSH